MDEEYMRMLYEAQQNKDVGNYEVEFFSFKDMSEQPKTKEDKLNELKEGLQDAIDKEDYTRAADIQKNISELESEGNQED
jgi:protein-arginine kinase activator protein McsA